MDHAQRCSPAWAHKTVLQTWDCPHYHSDYTMSKRYENQPNSRRTVEQRVEDNVPVDHWRRDRAAAYRKKRSEVNGNPAYIAPQTDNNGYGVYYPRQRDARQRSKPRKKPHEFFDRRTTIETLPASGSMWTGSNSGWCTQGDNTKWDNRRWGDFPVDDDTSARGVPAKQPRYN